MPASLSRRPREAFDVGGDLGVHPVGKPSQLRLADYRFERPKMIAECPLLALVNRRADAVGEGLSGQRSAGGARSSGPSLARPTEPRAAQIRIAADVGVDRSDRRREGAATAEDGVH